jgi:hypothetical protein
MRRTTAIRGMHEVRVGSSTCLSKSAKQIDSAWLYRLWTDDLAELVRCALPTFLDPPRPGITRFQMVSAV